MRKRMIRLLSLFAAAFAFVSCDSEQGIKAITDNNTDNHIWPIRSLKISFLSYV